MRWLVLALLAVLVAAPLILRDRPLAPQPGTRRLVVVTPHGEAIRSEFASAFSAWMRRERGVAVELDWRTPGGTSEITRYLDDRYRAAFRERFPALAAQAAACNDPRVDQGGTPAQREARAAFLASDVGIGLDILFGGGEFPFRSHVAKGYLVDCGLLAREPGWFAGDRPIIPQRISGETVYDANGRYFAACYALFGIAWSPDRLRELGLAAPTTWDDLGTAPWRGRLTLADPSKSGAVVTAMERILQQAMARAGEPDLAGGWEDGFALIRQLVANSRAITDSASKPLRDVLHGDAAAAMAIDFQARAEGEWSAHQAQLAGVEGGPRVRFTVPVGGTSVSGDPIAMLRGAPEPELAREFIHFVLSPEGQRLWVQRVGTPGGPQHYALRRMSVRRDVAADDALRPLRSDPEDDPDRYAAAFTYHPAWTAPYYPLIGPLVKSLALDPREELTAAWTAICAAGGPDRVPEAWAQFRWLPFPYAEGAAVRSELAKGGEVAVPLLRTWTSQAILHYRLARAYAEAGR